MEPKEVDFEFTRGDTCVISFNLVDEEKNRVQEVNNSEIYFTVKQSYSSEEPIFQKKLSSEEIVEQGGSFIVTILPEDTQNLNYGNYVYDICIVSGDYTHTLAIGSINLTNEATHARNE